MQITNIVLMDKQISPNRLQNYCREVLASLTVAKHVHGMPDTQVESRYLTANASRLLARGEKKSREGLSFVRCVFQTESRTSAFGEEKKDRKTSLVMIKIINISSHFDFGIGLGCLARCENQT